MQTKELDSFQLSDAVKFHDKLNPKIWIGNKLRPEVSKQLKIITDDFLEEMGIHDLDVVDITISGSNAAYSYTKYSDIDLHILLNFKDLPDDKVYGELFNAKKTLYNDTHDIKIYGIPVELYVQDINQPHITLGEYSVLKDKWLRVPTKRRANFDQVSSKAKYLKLYDLINTALDLRDLSKINKTLDKIKQYRKAGLDKGGEFSPENIAYKALRNRGMLNKLFDLRNKLHSEKLTIETMYQNVSEKINPEMTKKDFYAEKEIDIKDIGSIKLIAKNVSTDYPQQFRIDVIHPDGNKIGYFRFVIHDYEPETKFNFFSKFKKKKEPYIVAGNVSVYDEFQKKGIATEVYKWVKTLGNDIKPSSMQTSAGKAMWDKWQKTKMDVVTDEDYDPNGPPPGPEFKPTMPKGTVKVDVSDVYDWYKLGQHISDLEGLGKHDFGQGPPSAILSFGDEDTEHKYIKNLMKTGLSTTDIDPPGHKKIKGQKVDPTYNVSEDETLQYAAEKTPAINPYGGLKDRQYRGAIGEAFDQPYKLKWEKSEHGDYDALATLDDGTYLSIMFNNEFKNNWMVEFYRNNSQEITGEGDAQRIFATVLMAIGQFIKKKKPVSLFFSAVKEDDPKGSRARLYNTLVNRYATNLGYSVTTRNDDRGMSFKLTRQVNEASGYIPSEKEKNDLRFKTALTVDVHPSTMKKDAKKFGNKISRSGIPPTASPSGKF